MHLLRGYLGAGCDPNEADGRGFTPLFLAATYGKEEAVKLLLDKAADVNAKGKCGQTALMAACCHGYIEIVILLLFTSNISSIRRPEWGRCFCALTAKGFVILTDDRAGDEGIWFERGRWVINILSSFDEWTADLFYRPENPDDVPEGYSWDEELDGSLVAIATTSTDGTTDFDEFLKASNEIIDEQVSLTTGKE